MGAFVYKFRKSGEENSELIDMCVKEIDELLAVLEENEKKINETRHKVKCSDCGALNDILAVYCMKCGGKLQREADDLYVEMYVDAVPTENIGVQQCDDEAKQEEANEEKSETEPERPSCDC